jgi:hypothetical protein
MAVSIAAWHQALLRVSGQPIGSFVVQSISVYGRPLSSTDVPTSAVRHR